MADSLSKRSKALRATFTAWLSNPKIRLREDRRKCDAQRDSGPV